MAGASHRGRSARAHGTDRRGPDRERGEKTSKKLPHVPLPGLDQLTTIRELNKKGDDARPDGTVLFLLPSGVSDRFLSRLDERAKVLDGSLPILLTLVVF